MLASSFRYLPLEIGDLDANFYEAFLGVEWRPWKNVGIGAAYLYTQADGNIINGSNTTAFDYQYDGPFMYLMFGW